VSAHKIHGPKGIGALYISPEVIKKKQIKPIIYGGGQEGTLRSGTENIIGIAGFGAAAERGYKSLSADVRAMRAQREYLLSRLSELDVRINLPMNECAPHIVNIVLPSIKSETMLHHLSANGIYVSSGSACSSNSSAKRVSRALRGFGLSDFEADCSMRISLSHYNTKEEIDLLVSAIKEGIDKLVKINKR
jgi:cysteine desulfurase